MQCFDFLFMFSTEAILRNMSATNGRSYKKVFMHQRSSKTIKKIFLKNCEIHKETLAAKSFFE